MCIVNLLLNVNDTDRRMFSVLPIALELRSPGIFVLKKGEKKESHVSICYLPVLSHSSKSLDVYRKSYVECE